MNAKERAKQKAMVAALCWEIGLPEWAQTPAFLESLLYCNRATARRKIISQKIIHNERHAERKKKFLQIFSRPEQ